MKTTRRDFLKAAAVPAEPHAAAIRCYLPVSALRKHDTLQHPHTVRRPEPNPHHTRLQPIQQKIQGLP